MSSLPARAPISRPLRAPLKRGLKFVSPVPRAVSEAIPVRVPKGKASSRAFSLIIGMVFLFGMLAHLLVNSFAAQAVYKKHTLQIELTQITAQQQQLASEITRQESPDRLLVKARNMGMVPASSPVFIRLRDNKILGKPVKAEARKFQ